MQIHMLPSKSKILQVKVKSYTLWKQNYNSIQLKVWNLNSNQHCAMLVILLGNEVNTNTFPNIFIYNHHSEVILQMI